MLFARKFDVFYKKICQVLQENLKIFAEKFWQFLYGKLIIFTGKFDDFFRKTWRFNLYPSICIYTQKCIHTDVHMWKSEWEWAGSLLVDSEFSVWR